MPGSIFEFPCEGCGTVQEIHTGTGYRPGGGGWEYRQWVCTACRLLVSRPHPAVDGETDPPRCDCGAELQPWPGTVWFDRDEDGIPTRERFSGPCPACGKTLTEQEGRAEGLIRIGIWD